jgi:hypothetical protein
VQPTSKYLVIGPKNPCTNHKSCSSPFCPRIKFVQHKCSFTNSTVVFYDENIPAQILQTISTAATYLLHKSPAFNPVWHCIVFATHSLRAVGVMVEECNAVRYDVHTQKAACKRISDILNDNCVQNSTAVCASGKACT